MIASLLLSLGIPAVLGGGWCVAALFFAPAAATLKSVLDFLRSPLGTALGVIALALFLYVAGWIGGDVHGSNATRAAWRADNAAKERAAASRAIALNVEMSGIVDAASGYDDKFGKIIDQKVAENAAQSPRRPECRATGADIGRLLSIR